MRYKKLQFWYVSCVLSQAAAPYLSDNSSVTFVASIAGYNPSEGLAMYGVTKTALLGLTKVNTATTF